MKVRNNSASVNTLRRFGINQTALQKDLEKLSSGYKINKAGDDAAGLAVSESMRERIKGLDQGHNNINDGISLLNVAEGGMEEITDMLQRISKLAHQAVNDTYSKENRQEIQSEIDELKNEIVRIADNTEFNDIKVLKLKKDDTWHTYNNTLPDWLINSNWSDTSSEMAVGNITGVQDSTRTDQTLIQLGNPKYDPVEEKFLYDYYGPEGTTPIDNNYMKFTYKRPWTESLEDNLSACIDFGGLIKKYDGSNSNLNAEDLYKDVYKLLGTSMGVSCATCDDPEVLSKHYYGFAFYGEAMDLDSGKKRDYVLDGMMFADNNGNPIHNVSENAIDLGKLLVPDENGEPLFDYLYSIVKDPSSMDLKDAAADVAKALYTKTYDGLERQVDRNNHYNDVLDQSDASQNIFKLGIYDYRDYEVNGITSVAIQTKATGYYREEPDPLWIQCSSAKNDRVPLFMPYVDLGSLGISPFDVSIYKDSVREVYNSKDLAREHAERNDDNNYDEVTVTIPDKQIHKVIPEQNLPIYKAMNDTTGEVKMMQVGTNHIPEQTIDITIPGGTYTSRKYTGYKATSTTEVVNEYIRPNIDEVTRAIDTISSYRAIYGAQYNRLEHSRNSNEVMNENVTAAESRIRDTNMASEMSKYQKDSMLMSVTEKMLGVADESTRGILDLLG